MARLRTWRCSAALRRGSRGGALIHHGPSFVRAIIQHALTTGRDGVSLASTAFRKVRARERSAVVGMCRSFDVPDGRVTPDGSFWRPPPERAVTPRLADHSSRWQRTIVSEWPT